MDITQPSEGSEDQFVDEIKQSIFNNTRDISEKVFKSAFAHLVKQGCFEKSKEEVAKKFFIEKIPAVLATQVAEKLNAVLGLDLDMAAVNEDATT
jgi:hypothetical protein